MALTKSALTFQASASNAADGTTTGAWVDLSGSYAANLTLEVTNGATGPTVGCTARVDIAETHSGTPSQVYKYCEFQAGVTANQVSQFQVVLPQSVMAARVVFTGNTGQAVTVEAYGSQVTAL